jgi:hypothetical protein
MDFADAVREDVKARLALAGPAGSGKTYSALAIGTGMGPNLGLIDTERRTALNYAKIFTFKHLPMPDTRPQTLVHALAIAARRGIDPLIIDGATPFWSGQGGLLAQVDKTTQASRSGNAFTSGWKAVKPIEHEMWDAILSYPGHVIITLRVKTAYELRESKSGGGKEPVKIGLRPDQREGVDYEFDLVGDLDMQHTMTIGKSRYPGPGGVEVNEVIEQPNIDFGQRIVKWLSDGVQLPTVKDYIAQVMDPTMTYEQLLGLYQGELSQRGLLGAAMFDPQTGEQTTLGGLIVRVGTERRAVAENASATTRAAEAADQTETRKAS